jgi:malonyl CoA-acyl carrier protein transacylase
MQAFVFPGQGSQKKGMGAGLFDEVAEFRSVEGEIDRLLGYSVRRLCLDDPQTQLNNTRYTQPALFVVNALHYYAAVRGGARPDFIAGHSLGEYNALLAAGTFDLLTGLQLVRKRGEIMSEAVGGGMAAVIGLTSSQVEEIAAAEGLAAVDVANYNSPTQTVISGPVAELTRAKGFFEKAGAQLVVMLPVSAAFHSRHMQAAARAFESFLNGFELAAPKIPVISNVTAQPYPDGGDSVAARSLLVRQIASPVRWVQSIRYLSDRGVTAFKELGPGNVLTRLIQQMR